MSTPDSQLKANKKYLKEKLDHISFRVPKGQREVISAHATRMGESVNAFITRVVYEAIEREGESLGNSESEK